MSWLTRALLLAGAALAAGCASPSRESARPATSGALADAGDGVADRELALADFRARVEARAGWIVDARPRVFYQLGHVPGAISLPRDDFESAYAANRDRLEKDRSRPIAVYCSDLTCDDSGAVGLALMKLGYTRVTVFRGGWAAWTAARLPEEKEHG